MKKILFCLFLISGMIACDSDSIISKVTAFIDGDTWKSITQVASLTGDKLNITATDSQGRILSLETSGYTKGTYTIGQTNYCAGSYKASATASTNDIYFSISGTITITSSGSSVSGTFDLVCAKNANPDDFVTITNGQFTNVRILNH
ncbi:MAG: DUF6252 family protein [Bacteroidales bacterium]